MKSTMFRNHPVLTASTTVKSLLVTALVNATGTGAFMSGSVLYFSSHLHIPGDTVAFTLSVCALVTLVTTVPLSAFLERFDLKQIIISLHIFRGLLYSSYLLADSVPLFIAVTLVVTIADRLSNPASQALLAAVLPSDQRVEIMAWRYSLQNAGVGLGALIVTVAIFLNPDFGYPLIMVLNGISFFIAAILMKPVDTVGTSAVMKRRNVFAGEWPNPRYLSFVALSVFFLLSDALLTVAIPLQISNRDDAAAGLVGLVLLVNTAITVFAQPRLSRDIVTTKVASRALVQAGFLLAAGAAVIGIFWLSSGWLLGGGLILGVAILTLGEARFIAASWWISVELAPEEKRARFLAVYSLSATAERAVGPLIASFVVIQFGGVGWAVAAMLFILCAAAVPAFKFVDRSPSETPA
ncbi:MFS transporter [Streptomyces sp. NPDC051132]|uniref:MFS transporter n=1 Tax=unclassified Streptomyces TaxID=2593676 RepID=UPI00344048C8